MWTLVHYNVPSGKFWTMALHIEAETTWPPFRRRHFEMHFLKWKFINFITAWCQPGDISLSEPMILSLLTHICVTRPQWINCCQEQEIWTRSWNCLFHSKREYFFSWLNAWNMAGRNFSVTIILAWLHYPPPPCYTTPKWSPWIESNTRHCMSQCHFEMTQIVISHISHWESPAVAWFGTYNHS